MSDRSLRHFPAHLRNKESACSHDTDAKSGATGRVSFKDGMVQPGIVP
jgi:hypothetical protein